MSIMGSRYDLIMSNGFQYANLATILHWLARMSSPANIIIRCIRISTLRGLLILVTCPFNLSPLAVTDTANCTTYQMQMPVY